jgi:hypothetical protein
MRTGTWDWLTADHAPWWWAGILGVVGVVVGGLIGSLNAKAADQRRTDAEIVRLEAEHQQERERYLRNRLLDEVGLLMGAVEALRLHIITGMVSVARGEDTKPDRVEPEDNERFLDIYNTSDDVVRGVSVQISRVLMITSGELAESVRGLNKAGRRFYMSGFKTKAKYDSAHNKLGRAVENLITATRSEIGVAAAETEPATDMADGD